MKRKLKLNRIILGGILLGSLSTFGVPLAIMHKVCPIGGEKFKDSYVPQCPTNKFVMFKEKFTNAELKKYEKIINGNVIKLFVIILVTNLLLACDYRKEL